ncbi:phage tail tube protein [Sphingomonas faeni]|uniref:phage tail tube protein n=1 Tax=Sphingomonas faeni TaxID=185950 RepID=UPI00334AEFD1
MGRARGQNAIMALGFETAYGTPPANGYTKLPFVSCNLGAEQGLIESDLLGQGRAPYDPTYDVVTNDGDVVVPLDANGFPLWLKLLFGAPTTFPFTGGYAHLFSAGLPSLPSASIEVGLPDRPSFSTNYGIRANTLQVNMQRSGLANATIGLVGKGETVPSLTTNAGTPAPVDLFRFASGSGSIFIDGVVVGEVTAAQVSYSNGLDKDETIRADGEINDVDPGMPSASLSLTTKFADLALYNKATAKVPVAVELKWNIAGIPNMVIAFPRLFLPRVKRPITGPGGVMAEFRGIGSAGNGGVLFTVQMTNMTPSYG